MYPLMTSNATVLGSSLISNKILLLVFCESKFNASGIDFFCNVHFMSKCRNPLFRSHWFFFVLSLNSCLFRSSFCRRCYLLFFIIFLIHLLTSFAIFCFTSACGLSVFEETNTTTLREKYPNTEFFLVHILRYSARMQKNTDQKTPYLDTFHVVQLTRLGG